jgi:hypothetical protein
VARCCSVLFWMLCIIVRWTLGLPGTQCQANLCSVYFKESGEMNAITTCLRCECIAMSRSTLQGQDKHGKVKHDHGKRI